MKARIFALVFIVAGLALAYVMARQILESLAPYAWKKAECLIKRSDVIYGVKQEHACSHSLAYEYEASGLTKTGSTWRLDSGVPYEWCSDWASFASNFSPTAKVSCHIDPLDPDRAVLDQGSIFSIFKLILPIGLTCIGIALLRRKSSIFPISKVGVKRLGQGVAVCTALTGAVATVYSGVLPMYVSYDSRTWNKAECEVLWSALRTSSGSASSPGAATQNRGYYIDIVYTYAMDGRSYVSDRYDFSSFGSGSSAHLAQVTDKYPVGAKVSCSVSPDNPYEAVLVPGLSTQYLWGFLPLLGMPIGFLLWRAVRRIS